MSYVQYICGDSITEYQQGLCIKSPVYRTLRIRCSRAAPTTIQRCFRVLNCPLRTMVFCNLLIQLRGWIMEAISFEAPTVFVPEPIHIHILQAVGDKQGCHISHVVQQLLPSHGESSVRSSIRVLLSKRYLDGGKSSAEIVLRLTSSGRLLLQKASVTWFFFVSLSTTDKPHNIFVTLFRVSWVLKKKISIAVYPLRLPLITTFCFY